MPRPGEPDRLAEEEKRPAPPSQAVIASAVTGPTPYSRAARALGPGQVPGRVRQPPRSSSRRPSRQASMSRAVATGSCPAWANTGARPRPPAPRPPAPRPPAPRRRPASCAARPRSAAGRLAGEDRVDALHPGGVLGPQIVIQPPAAPGIPGCGRAGPSTPAARRRPAAAEGAPSRSSRAHRPGAAGGQPSRPRRDRCGSLSKGLRQRVALARALLNDPAVLFLDEPTSGLDPVATREVHDLLASLRERGVTIFLTTHRLEEAERLCHRVAILTPRCE